MMPVDTTACAIPRVSVIMIFLNAERFIAEAIESVLEQTFGEWELVLVDDGSSDGSTQLARNAAAGRPSRIRYLDHPGHANLGMSASRNAGIREARGEYVAFLDADDVFLPERLARHVEVLDAMPRIAMVQSDHIQWYGWAGESQKADDDFIRPMVCLGDRIIEPPLALLTVLAVPWLTAAITSLTVRREIAVRLGGFETDFRDMYEDQVFTTKVYLEYPIYVLQDWLVRYRRHPDSWTRHLKETGQFVEGLPHPTTEAFHDWFRQYLQSRGVRHALLEDYVPPLRTGTPLDGLRELAVRVVGKSKALIERALPVGLRRMLSRWDRRQRHARLQRAYTRLCARVQAFELQRRALDGVRHQ